MNAPARSEPVTLQDKYVVNEGWIYLTGSQALARLPMQQRRRDQAAGLNTGGFISGYRGSPMGRYDMELWAQEPLLEEHNIRFMPGINEDLAVTAIWGAQYIGVLPGSTVDGVFGIWYGKGPGTDRSGDALRHVGVAGTGKFGGALALAGDDHGCKSSTIYNYSDPTFIAAGIPVLYPSNTQELLDYGLHGFAMSRFSGCWVGMKVHNDVVEGGGSVYVAPDAPAIVLPDLPGAAHLGPQGRNIRVLDLPLMGEERLYHHKLPAVLEYMRANKLNRTVLDTPGARVGILSAGKSYQDVMQALAELGIGEREAASLGLRVGKLAMVWPLEPEYIAEFARGLDAILVVEEKRALVEDQLKAVLYDLPASARRPRVLGKYDGASPFAAARGAGVLQGWGELSPPVVGQALVQLLRQLDPRCPLPEVKLPTTGLPPGAPNPGSPIRNPGFCSGCPHNRSTQVPEGSRAMIGIGCHGMAALNDPLKTPPMFTQMGAEGIHWLGQHGFTAEKHVFVNMGDGTYFHSGFLAIRQALASKANMTYKILVNGFVSMTGGQPIDGELSVRQIVTELRAEGVKEIVVLTDEVAKHEGSGIGVPVLDRSELEAQMLRLREVSGLSVIVYDQPCATERRRLRKRGQWADPPKRTFINAAVCEGCGECSKVSNCLSIEPLETPFGRKRQINQSSCNKDFSCVEGFCPSFVTVHGGALRKTKTSDIKASGHGFPDIPEPVLPALSRDFSVLITGVGGTGVVTIGQVLGMAAHLDGLACSVLDVTGLAQKYGAVMSHVRLAPDASHLHATRIASGQADTVIGCDLVVTAGDEGVSRIQAGRSHVFVATDVVPTSEFSRNPDWQLGADTLIERIRARCGSEQLVALEGLRIAKALMGDTIAANMFMLGAAWQRGRVPVTHQALMRAIELNKVQIEFNKAAFLWGRRAVHDLPAVEAAAAPGTQVVHLAMQPSMSLTAVVQRSVQALTEYQNEAYAQRYLALVERVTSAERPLQRGDRLATAVARNYFKLLAYKDEFEVARLYSSPQFRSELAAQFEGDFKLGFHVGAWPFAGTDAQGRPVKKEVGPWLLSVFGVLAAFKGIRGTWLDPFRHSAERKLALSLLAQYEQDIEQVLAGLNGETHARALEIASLPEKIRGYGHVRERHAQAVAKERAQLMES
jgi:indolepyruvate ferredoxin oxidoreductase